VSWGDGCGGDDHPGVYADVGFYYNWISEHVDWDYTTVTTIPTTLPAFWEGSSQGCMDKDPTGWTDSTDDTPLTCEVLRNWGYCDPDVQGGAVLNDCPVSCRLCTPGSTVATTLPATWQGRSCTDQNPTGWTDTEDEPLTCSQLRDWGYCDVSKMDGQVLDDCPATCRMCLPAAEQATAPELREAATAGPNSTTTAILEATAAQTTTFASAVDTAFIAECDEGGASDVFNDGDCTCPSGTAGCSGSGCKSFLVDDETWFYWAPNGCGEVGLGCACVVAATITTTITTPTTPTSTVMLAADETLSACTCKDKWTHKARTNTGCVRTSEDITEAMWCYTNEACAGSTPSTTFPGWNWAECVPVVPDDGCSGFKKRRCARAGDSCQWVSGRGAGCYLAELGARDANINDLPCKTKRKRACRQDDTCLWWKEKCLDNLVCEVGTSDCCGMDKGTCYVNRAACTWARNSVCIPRVE
jgi:hypothetical protein